MLRFAILAAAVSMQLCLGATYAWSVFTPALRASGGMGQGAAQVPFTTFYIAFPVMTLFAGAILARLGPRRCALLSGLFYGGGWMLAGLGARHFFFTIAGVGVLAGVGVGFGYLVPITIGVQWFPRHKGLVTGVAVAGFGGSAWIVSWLADRFMSIDGLSAYQSMGRLGLVFALVIPLAGSMMIRPPAPPQGAPLPRPSVLASASSSIVLREPLFWKLYFCMFAGLAGGLAINANLRHLGAGLASTAGVRAIMVFAMANAVGRLAWGWIFDRVPARRAIACNLALQAAALAAAPFLVGGGWGLWSLAALVGFNYGGVLVLYAATADRVWGSARLGYIYGWMFSSNMPAALAPMAAGFVFDRVGGFTPALIALSVLLMIASALAPACGDKMPRHGRPREA